MSSEATLPEKEILNRQPSCLMVGGQELFYAKCWECVDNVYLPCYLPFAIIPSGSKHQGNEGIIWI